MVNFDTVIVGGSLAGASAALSLAAKGMRVALIDMKSHPKQKACGAGLSRQGLGALFGNDINLQPYPHRILEGYSIHHYGKRPIRLASFDGIGISRSTLDKVIFDRLRKYPNLTILEGLMVKNIEKEGGIYKVGGMQDYISSRSLILACGNNGKLLRDSGIPILNTGTEQIGASVEYITKKPIVDSYVHVHHLKQASICVTPISESRINLSWISHPGIFCSRNEIVNDLQKISRIYGAINDSTELLGASSIGARISPAFYNGIFVVGDAVCQLDPIGGMGMTNAIQSGKFAANAILDLLWNQEGGIADLTSNHPVIRRYIKKVNSIVNKNRRFTALASWGVRSNWSHGFLELAQSSKFIQKMMVSVHSSSGVST